MDWNALWNGIGTVGFPIVACIVLMIVGGKALNNNTKAIKELEKTNNKLNELITTYLIKK